MKQRILILAKTYPCPSKKYGELVCTAGITEQGKWVRIYPIVYRKLSKEHRYKKYQWIEADLIKDTSDPRVESYKINGDITLLETVDTRSNWILRKELILKNFVYISKINLLYDCRDCELQTSLAIFKAKDIIGFHIEIVKNPKNSEVTYILPFTFYYVFTDNNGLISRLQIIDWEIGELARKLIRQYKDDVKTIKKILRQKYFYDMKKRDIYLFLGTNREWHIRRSLNPFMIIGVFYPPKIENYSDIVSNKDKLIDSRCHAV